MIVFCNLLSGVGAILYSILSLFLIVIFISVILSWISADRGNMIVQIINGLAEPILEIFRRRIPAFGGMDWSPIWAGLALMLLQYVVAQSLIDYGQTCRASAIPITVGL